MGVAMEFILIHRPRGPLPLEISKQVAEFGKKINMTPGEVVPGGKLLASYHARCEDAVFCIWDVPNAENLMPALEQLTLLGYDTQVIPAEKVSDAIPKWEKALAEASK